MTRASRIERLDYLKDQLRKRVVILDGAMGTNIQKFRLEEEDYRGERFADAARYPNDLKNNNDLLVLTRPEIILDIHRRFLDTGRADILETCTFGATSIGQHDYFWHRPEEGRRKDQEYFQEVVDAPELKALVRDLNMAASALARQACDEAEASDGRPRFVAGSIGPMPVTCSLSPDVNDPGFRAVNFRQLRQAYRDQVLALLEGGVDMLLVETIFDTLNAKAALFAIEEIFEEQPEAAVPVMVSVTLTDKAGRTLSGQTIEAFWNSIRHVRPFSVGINCALGPDLMRSFAEELSGLADCYVSIYANAGLPNPLSPTGYDLLPEDMARFMKEYASLGLLNIVGGCCGTTPLHIFELAKIVNNYTPRPLPQRRHVTCLSGLEQLRIVPEANFVNVGERTNVAGSAKFARLIREKNYEEALSVARAQVEAGANIVDVCMDDGLIDGPEAMRDFLNLMGSEPEISAVPVMIDSSKWEVLETGLRVVQGKSVVNSISLKEGEQEFLHRARLIRRYGAAAVVMLFDEQGQADTYARKIEVAQRAYKLLTDDGFPAEDIIFDPNILAVATGIEAHDAYARDFIEAVRWIKRNLPHAKISGGVSNLSFAFRGNNAVREAMHSVFLYHAIQAGMDMAIVNPQMLQIYSDIEPGLLERVEDVILCRRADAAERLTEYASQFTKTGATQTQHTDAWRSEPLGKRIEYAMLKGVADYIEQDALEGYRTLGSPLAVIDQLLMPAMEVVGNLFGQGKMFLPQVVKTARVMKKAVAVLTPYIEQGSEANAKSAGKVLVATVKGDVHDIGKNIVAVVMACNGYTIRDLGVMVECPRIIDEAVAWGADAICLSGLITPSLEEMIHVCEELERRGLQIPVLIGGATTSDVHTAVKIAPTYSGPVIHADNASRNNKILGELLGPGRED